MIGPVYSTEVISRLRLANSLRSDTAKYWLANHIEVSPVLLADYKAPVGFTGRHLQRDLQFCGVRNSSGQFRRNLVQAKRNVMYRSFGAYKFVGESVQLTVIRLWFQMVRVRLEIDHKEYEILNCSKFNSMGATGWVSHEIGFINNV